MGAVDEGKLFVGGISWDTTQEILKNHFNKYGAVLGSLVARDRLNGKPRGFGFVWFSDPSSAHFALQQKHVISGREVEVKKAIPRGEQSQGGVQIPQSNRSSGSSIGGTSSRKIFVGGLASSLTQQQFKSYFEKFGTITDVVVMHDSATHRPRGFGFVTFDMEYSVKNVMQKSFHELNGKLVEVKRAVPKDCTKTTTSSSHGCSRQFSYGYCQQQASFPYSYPMRGTFPTYPNFNGYSGLGTGYLYGVDGYGGGICYGGMSSFPIPGVYPVHRRSAFGPPVFVGNGCGTAGVIVYGGGVEQWETLKSDWGFKSDNVVS